MLMAHDRAATGQGRPATKPPYTHHHQAKHITIKPLYTSPSSQHTSPSSHIHISTSPSKPTHHHQAIHTQPSIGTHYEEGCMPQLLFVCYSPHQARTARHATAFMLEPPIKPTLTGTRSSSAMSSYLTILGGGRGAEGRCVEMR